jgi:hypothetical protein
VVVATQIPVRPADGTTTRTRATRARPARTDGGDDRDGGPLRDLARLVYYLVQAYDAVRDLSTYGRRLARALSRLWRALR